MVAASAMAAAGLLLAAPAASAAPVTSSTISVNGATAASCQPAHHGNHWRWHKPDHGHAHWDHKKWYWEHGERKWKWHHHYHEKWYCKDHR